MGENNIGPQGTSTSSDPDSSLSRPSPVNPTLNKTSHPFPLVRHTCRCLQRAHIPTANPLPAVPFPHITKTPADADTDSDVPYDRTAGGGHAHHLSLTTAPTNLMCPTSTMETVTDHIPEPHPVVALQAATSIDRVSRNHITGLHPVVELQARIDIDRVSHSHIPNPY
jgi:hypothetical protein